MKLVVGLGNPGSKYKNTRHNVGFRVVDKIVGDTSWAKSKSARLVYAWQKFGSEKVEIVKPQTFMNQSGLAVSAVFKKHNELDIQDLFVVHDDLDIKLGQYKVQKGKGPKEHNGLLSVYEKIGTKDFWHVRVGIENRGPASQIPGEDYVLQKFTEKEFEILNPVLDEVVVKLSVLLH